MQKDTLTFQINYRRVAEHIAFWLMALVLLTIYFGGNKPSYLWALQDNLLYLPVHIIYFYVLAYWAMPRYLYTKRYISFSVILLFCILSSALVTRVLDILIIDPRAYKAYLKEDPDFVWEKLQGTFTEQLLGLQYYNNAVKGSNLVIWVALTIKFFKMWYERKQAALESELNFLKGQIHPHFLFNTLNNLYALTLAKSDQAPPIIVGLSEILRHMLYESKADTITLKRDVEIIESYLALEKIRYEERLDMNFTMSEHLEGYQIAPLLLLPLIENAFKHGTSEKVGKAWIVMDLTVKANKLKFKISNSKPQQLPQDLERHKGLIGLANVKKRLEILYPNAHDLKIFDEDDMFALILDINLDKYTKL